MNVLKAEHEDDLSGSPSQFQRDDGILVWFDCFLDPDHLLRRSVLLSVWSILPRDLTMVDLSSI